MNDWRIYEEYVPKEKFLQTLKNIGGDVFQEKSSEFTGKLLHTSFDTVERFLQNGVARGVAH